MSVSGLLHAYYLTDDGYGKKITDLNTLDRTRTLWLHFDYSSSDVAHWLRNHSQLPAVVIDALLNEETRPRTSFLADGALMSLRGVNLAPNNNPEDMVSIRVWLTENLVITSRRRKLLSIADIVEDFESGTGPRTTAEFIDKLTSNLNKRMSNTIYSLDDRIDEIEEQVLLSETFNLRTELAELRRQVIGLRRYLAPQKEAMQQLCADRNTFVPHDNKIYLRETLDTLTRYLEDLDTMKDRAAVSQEELSNRLSEQLNNRMYVLSIVAAVFLPLGFLTGLLGINVGGIPGSENTSAFYLFAGFLFIIVLVQVWLLKRFKWI